MIGMVYMDGIVDIRGYEGIFGGLFCLQNDGVHVLYFYKNSMAEMDYMIKTLCNQFKPH
jgi:hypothetical protein